MTSKEKALSIFCCTFCCLCVIILSVLLVLTVKENREKEMLERIEQVVPITFADSSGNTIVYYICKSTYFDFSAKVTGLDIEAFSNVIDPETADESRICEVNGKEAMLYENRERNYLCWTVAPEYTLVLEYSPESVTEAEILRIAESVPMGQNEQ